jgi:prefoldin subunit 5
VKINFVQKQIEENLKSYDFIISELKKEIDYLKQEQDKLKKFIDKNKNIHNNNPLTRIDTDIFAKFQLALNKDMNTDIKDYRKIFKQRLLMKEYDSLRLRIEKKTRNTK